MKISLNYGTKESNSQTHILGVFAKDKGLDFPKWPRDLKETFLATPGSNEFDGKTGNFIFFNGNQIYLVFGLGEKKKFKNESLRRIASEIYTTVKAKYNTVCIHVDQFSSNLELATELIGEGIYLTDYSFDRYLSKKEKPKLAEVFLYSTRKSAKSQKALEAAKEIASSINVARDFINEPPNIQRSTTYAKEIEKDIRDNLKGKGVKVKVLGKKELKKENMNLFLSVNAGSAFEPQLVHLTYTPKKANRNTKHIALVGKGLVFDTGGYSLKPGASMVNMKFDMGGSATVYGAFRAAALAGINAKITCILGITDNSVNSHATMPDSIVKGRNGKTVEILNTDAEGRLVLADCLDYTCDLKPDFIIDAATLTGACLVALGTEVGAVMTNNQKFADKLLKSAKTKDEYLWQLPIVDEFRNDMKSQIADLSNIAPNRWGGTPKAAAFLEEFIKNDIPWCHLDVAGIADTQAHLPYCPKKGGSGLLIRTIFDFMKNA